MAMICQIKKCCKIWKCGRWSLLVIFSTWVFYLYHYYL